MAENKERWKIMYEDGSHGGFASLYTPSDIPELRTLGDVASLWGSVDGLERAMNKKEVNPKEFLTDVRVLRPEGEPYDSRTYYACVVFKVKGAGSVALLIGADCTQETIALAGPEVSESSVRSLALSTATKLEKPKYGPYSKRRH